MADEAGAWGNTIHADERESGGEGERRGSGARTGSVQVVVDESSRHRNTELKWTAK